jgi:phytoene synthase
VNRHDEAADAQSVLARHSRSFRFASLLIPEAERADLAILYAFCRRVDDIADHNAGSPRAALRELRTVRDAVKDHDTSHQIAGPLLRMAERRGVDLSPALHLISGAASDLKYVRVQTDRELLYYCYRVAGTVGLMIREILGARTPESRSHAIALGTGMQLTNIARDVGEDLEMGRIYLPEERCPHGQVHRAFRENDPDAREQVFESVCGLLGLARMRYRHAEAGIRYLPPRARWGILTAGRVYEAIGTEIRAAGPERYFSRRAHTSGLRKAALAAKAGADLIIDPIYRTPDRD